MGCFLKVFENPKLIVTVSDFLTTLRVFMFGCVGTNKRRCWGADEVSELQ